MHLPKGDFSSLAPKSWYGKAAPRFRCRNNLREITHVTYLIKDEQTLGQLEEDQIFWGMQRKVIHVIKESPTKIKKRKAATSSKGNP